MEKIPVNSLLHTGPGEAAGTSSIAGAGVSGQQGEAPDFEAGSPQA